MPERPRRTDRIPVGYVSRPHGVRGATLVVALGDDPGLFTAAARLSAVAADGSGEPVHLTITRTDPHNHGLVVYFEEVGDRDAAAALKGMTLTVDRSARRVLGDDEFWPDELEGLVALTPNGARLGVVTGVEVGDAQDRLIVSTPDGADVEVPFVAAIVIEVTADAVVIDAPGGLF